MLSSDMAGVPLAPADLSVTVPFIITDEPICTPMSGAVTVGALGPLPKAYICESYELYIAIMLSPITGPPPQLVVRSDTSHSFSPVSMSIQRNGAPRGRGLTGECSLC